MAMLNNQRVVPNNSIPKSITVVPLGVRTSDENLNHSKPSTSTGLQDIPVMFQIWNGPY